MDKDVCTLLWDSLQGFQGAPWDDLLDLWRYFNLHLAHVIRTVNEKCIDHIWVVNEDTSITLGELMIDYLRHLNPLAASKEKY